MRSLFYCLHTGALHIYEIDIKKRRKKIGKLCHIGECLRRNHIENYRKIAKTILIQENICVIMTAIDFNMK